MISFVYLWDFVDYNLIPQLLKTWNFPFATILDSYIVINHIISVIISDISMSPIYINSFVTSQKKRLWSSWRTNIKIPRRNI